MNQLTKQHNQRSDQQAKDQPLPTQPSRSITAAELEKALAPVEFPKSKAELIKVTSRQITMDAPIEQALESIPERVYQSAAEVAAAFGEVASKQRPAAAPRAS